MHFSPKGSASREDVNSIIIAFSQDYNRTVMSLPEPSNFPMLDTLDKTILISYNKLRATDG